MAEKSERWASDLVEALSHIASQAAERQEQAQAILAEMGGVQGPTATEVVAALTEHGLSASEAMPAPLELRELAETLVNLGRLFELEPEETKKAYRALSERGWVLPSAPWAPDIEQINALVDEQHVEQLETLLCTKVRARAIEFVEDAIAVAPKREQVLRRALELHRSGDFIASVPLFLAQADGLTVDLFSGALFTNQRIKGVGRRTRAWVALRGKLDGELHIGSTGVLLDVLMQMLEDGTGIALHTDERDKKRKARSQGVSVMFSPLNRHGVLHGLDVEYGTEGNSLRCIALIGCLCEFAEVFKFRNATDDELLDTYS